MNKSTRLFVTVYGIIFGISGICHGFFEALQGNKPTGGFFISAIGEAQRMWPHGNEYALTLIPNFLIAGIVTMLIGLAIIIWVIGFVHKRNGPAVLLILFIALLLAGGGVAQTLFFPLIWLVSTRIHSPLAWWRKAIPAGLQPSLAKSWIWFLAVGGVFLSAVLVIGITGFVPAVPDPDTVLSIMLSSLCLVVVCFPIAIIAGFARDILARNRDNNPEAGHASELMTGGRAP